MQKDSESACVYYFQKFIENLDIHQPMRELSKKEKQIMALSEHFSNNLKTTSLKTKAMFIKNIKHIMTTLTN